MRPAMLVQVPFMCGDGSHPAAAGPARVARAAGLPSVVVDGGGDGDESLRVNRQLSDVVRGVVAAGALPLVVAGSCDASLGVLAGRPEGDCGIVWLDAHGDFNTPASSQSGFLPGMSLAIAVGDCHRERWAQVGGAPVAEGTVVLLGVRDLSPDAERERLAASAIAAVPPGGDAIAALDALARRTRYVYLHVDLDAFDPAVAPGIVDDPVPGGLSRADGERIVRAVVDRFAVRAATIATYVPARDRDDRTLALVLDLIELLRRA
jgi:arginase